MAVDLLKIKDLKTHFPIKKGIFKRTAGWIKAVDGVSLTIKKNEVTGLVGESGCGKTTLGRSVLRLVEPVSGSVIFRDVDVLGQDGKGMRKLRRDMQIIFQDPFSSLNPRMTVGSILSEPLKIHKFGNSDKIRSRVREMLSVVGLDSDYAGRYPHEFSGGQRQRICIARALMLNPEFVVADEAVSALDVSIQAQIINLLIDLRGRFGLTYLFISHDLSVVRHIADNVAVMYLGRIVEKAQTDALFNAPLHPYTEALLSAVPEPVVNSGRKRIVLHGDVPSPSSPPSGCHFHERCPYVMDICREKYPSLIEKNGRVCACWKVNPA
ncbi:MAG: ABC transporter ATP-binding protein [Fibrobacterota bacterium]